MIYLKPFSSILKSSSWSSWFFFIFSSSKFSILSNFSLILSNYWLCSFIAFIWSVFCLSTILPNLWIYWSFYYFTLVTLLETMFSTVYFSWTIFRSCLTWNCKLYYFSAKSLFITSNYLLIVSSHFSFIYRTSLVLLSSTSSAFVFHLSTSS